MTIAQISMCYQPVHGGQEVYIDNLIKIFKNESIDSQVYQNWRKGKYENSVMVPRVPFLHRLIPNINEHIHNFFLLLLFRNRLKKSDLILCHYGIHALPVWDFKKKVIVLSHGIEWNTERQSISRLIKERINKKIIGRFKLVVNDTHFLRHFGYDIKPAQNYFQEVLPAVWFIPNCVDTTHFDKKESLEEFKGKKFILIPRQIVPDRGIDLGIRAFYLFQKSFPEYKLLILGSPLKGPYYKQCKELITELEIEKKINFYGNVSNKKMPGYYSSATITLIPTIRREGTSLSALESMACGTATISTNVAGLRDLPTVQSDPTPEAISKAIQFTLSDQERIKAEQYKKVREVFNQTNWKNAWLKVINSYQTIC